MYVSLKSNWAKGDIYYTSWDIMRVNVQIVAVDDGPDCRSIIAIVRSPVEEVCTVKDILGVHIPIFVGVKIAFCPQVTQNWITKRSFLPRGSLDPMLRTFKSI